MDHDLSHAQSVTLQHDNPKRAHQGQRSVWVIIKSIAFAKQALKNTITVKTQTRNIYSVQIINNYLFWSTRVRNQFVYVYPCAKNCTSSMWIQNLLLTSRISYNNNNYIRRIANHQRMRFSLLSLNRSRRFQVVVNY